MRRQWQCGMEALSLHSNSSPPATFQIQSPQKKSKLEFKNVGKKIIAINEWWVDFFGYLKIR